MAGPWSTQQLGLHPPGSYSTFRSRQSPRRPPEDLITRLHNTSLNAPPRELARLPSFAPFDSSQFNADSSSSDSDIHPSRPRRPAHSRSMSHPIQSFFSSKKKRLDNAEGLDSSDNEPPVTRKTPKGHQRGNMSGGGSRDFATGNCVTCNSLVRWPRDLAVFKCTVCVTINDLPPQKPTESRSNNAPRWLRGPSQGQNALASTPSKGSITPSPRADIRPLSLDDTRTLIEHCIRAFLSGRVYKKSTGHAHHGHAGLSPDDTNVVAVLDSVGRSWDLAEHSESKYVFKQAPTLRAKPQPPLFTSRSYSASFSDRPLGPRPMPDANARRLAEPAESHENDEKKVFKPLEDHLISCFSSFECINSSFPTQQASKPLHSQKVAKRSTTTQQACRSSESQICDLDPKLLLLGDVAENGLWWTGEQAETNEQVNADAKRPARSTSTLVTLRSPRIDWTQLRLWYNAIINTAETWESVYDDLRREESFATLSRSELEVLERTLLLAQDRVQRVLLKATEMLLKRPGRSMTEPEDMRFLLLILENPLLHANPACFGGSLSAASATTPGSAAATSSSSKPKTGPISGQHSGITKRVIGLMSNASEVCQAHLSTWFARYPDPKFVMLKDLVSSFLNYRLVRQNEKKHEVHVGVMDHLIPDVGAGRSAASLHAALGAPGSAKKQKQQPDRLVFLDDWQIRAAARVLSLLFIANNTSHVRKTDTIGLSPLGGAIHRSGVQVHGQIVPTSDFYNSMIDYTDLIADFEAWESKRAKFSFCQYPFLLSMWAKSQILEHDARRQMMNIARDAFFDSIMTRKNVTQHLTLDIRRDCLVEDSLTAVGEVIGTGSEDIKKRLRIVFRGEEGYDAGGLRKEWFLLLVRELFNPEHGMFLYDEDSLMCYFNPSSFETSDQFFLVGVVLGLAIYNSTILDITLPPFAYRKLMASAPISPSSSAAHPRPTMSYTLDDLAEYHPRLASGLKKLLDFDGDVEETFGLDFVAPVERYGTVSQASLCSGGEQMPVTNANRREYVDLYVKYILDTSVTRQFEPFKRGFFTVCGGSALSLFRPEEIELLVRGSDAALDIDTLRGVAEYDNWGMKQPDGTIPVVGWFWDTFKSASPKEQRKLLLFITGSDRIPAMGAAVLPIKISCLGDDDDRYPIARTCFNMLALRRYSSRERLEHMLWTAVHGSEGFGLK